MDAVINCIERMIESWLWRCVIDLASVFILVAGVVFAMCLFIAGDEVKERSRKK